MSEKSFFERWIDKLVAWFLGAGSIWICCFLTLILADIVARGLFNHPIPGVAEVVALSVVVCFFLQMPGTLSASRLNRVQLFTQGSNKISPKAVRVIELMINVLGMVTFAALVYASFPTFVRSWVSGEFIGVQGTSAVPTWPARLTVVTGCSLVCIKFAMLGLKDLRSIVGS